MLLGRGVTWIHVYFYKNSGTSDIINRIIYNTRNIGGSAKNSQDRGRFMDLRTIFEIESQQEVMDLM